MLQSGVCEQTSSRCATAEQCRVHQSVWCVYIHQIVQLKSFVKEQLLYLMHPRRNQRILSHILHMFHMMFKILKPHALPLYPLNLRDVRIKRSPPNLVFHGFGPP